MYEYLKANGKIGDVKGAKTSILNINSDHILEMIEKGESGWEKAVPNRVADAIKRNHLFHYPYDVPMDEDLH